MKSVAIVGTALLMASPAWCQAYQLDDNGLNVAPEHWPAWNFPPGSLDFSDEGVWAHICPRSGQRRLGR